MNNHATHEWCEPISETSTWRLRNVDGQWLICPHGFFPRRPAVVRDTRYRTQPTLDVTEAQALQDGALLDDGTEAVGGKFEAGRAQRQVTETAECAKRADRLAQPCVEEVSRQRQSVQPRLRPKVELGEDLKVCSK